MQTIAHKVLSVAVAIVVLGGFAWMVGEQPAVTSVYADEATTTPTATPGPACSPLGCGGGD